MVNRHQADDVGCFGKRGGERFLRLARDELRELGNEAIEIDRAALVGEASAFEQLIEVGQFAVAQEFAEEDGVVAGAIECGVEQIGDRDAVFDGAEMANRGGGGDDFGSFFGGELRWRLIGEQAGVEGVGSG